ncbi:MAG: SRPBCC domain-containing protein, partial [Propionibacteriales bacterium]|nr:SRPBCC domain-containing protein [Propionibacteriales bacterium]
MDGWDSRGEHQIFHALGDPTRRQLLDLLRRRDGLTLTDLTIRLASPEAGPTRQAVSKHVTVLQQANLVSVVRQGRNNLHYLNPIPLQQLTDRWFRPYDGGRPATLTRLKQTLEAPAMTTPNKPQFVYTLYILATRAEVYHALTDPELIAEYMGGTGPHSDFQVGSPVFWKSNPDGEFEDLDQQITEAEPGRVLAYTWHRLQQMHRPMFDTDAEFETARAEQSRVRFDIEDAEEAEMGTKLTITHHGFDSPNSKMLEGVTDGWTMILSALKTSVERRTP